MGDGPLKKMEVSSFDIRGLAPLLMVYDMPASLAFYRDVLGFQIKGESGGGDMSGWVLLEKNGTELMLNTQFDEGERPDERDQQREKWHEDTCIYFGCPDPDALYEHLRSKGLDIQPPSTAPYGMRQLYVKDPDGFNLCFQWEAKP